MPSDRPLLTIAIPTFNRAKFLRQLLSLLVAQLAGQSGVELIISDNASTDETPAVVEEYAKNGFKFRYVRNQVNVGSDANFLACFKQATGKYVWLVGDDDIILPGAIPKILSLLSARDYALVYLCPYSFQSDYVKERQHDKFRRFAQTFANGRPFIRKVGTSIAFISAMIVNKDRFNTTDHPELAGLDGTNLMHLGWLLPVLGSGGVSLIIWERLVAARDGNTGAWSTCQVFGYRLHHMLKLTLIARDSIAREIVNNTLRTWFPLMIMQIRLSRAGALLHEDFQGSLRPLHRNNWRFWFYVFPVAAFPEWAARVWYLGTQAMNRAGRLLELVVSYPRRRRDLISDSR